MVEIYSTVLKAMKENQEHTSGDYFFQHEMLSTGPFYSININDCSQRKVEKQPQPKAVTLKGFN